jgi:hypothetical protein
MSNNNNNVAGGIFGLAFIGALIYFLKGAGSFSAVIWGILKAMVWPAILIYKLFEFLKI